MRYELIDKPDYGMVLVTFEAAGESIVAEAGAMVARDVGVKMQTALQGGPGGAFQRGVLGGESFFLNTFTASAPEERLYLAPAPEGDLDRFTLEEGEELILQRGSFVAAEPTVEVAIRSEGFKGLLSGEGLFFLRCHGAGDLFFNTYGGLHRIELDGSGHYVVDTSHVVAFTAGLDYNINKIGGIKSLLFSGEGLVCEFRGRGSLWVQTRSPDSLASFLHLFRPVESKERRSD